jgi:TetR/AcrR family transcriptional repressor of nem operon
MTTKSPGDTKTKLLDAALAVIRAKGYSAATVDEICRVAGVTKGAFFHHFASKDKLAVAAAAHNATVAVPMFLEAPYRELPDPLDRLLGYVEFRKELLRGELSEYTCPIGTMVQEAYETHPAIREACDTQLREHAAMVAVDISATMDKYGIVAEWSAESLGLYTQAVIQGALILAKAQHGPAVAVACIDHLRRYLELLFDRAPRPRARRPATRRRRRK